MGWNRKKRVGRWVRRNVEARDKGVCFYCKQLAVRPTYDHVRPWYCHGKNNIWNIVTACYRCNMDKGGKFDHALIDEVVAHTCKYFASLP